MKRVARFKYNKQDWALYRVDNFTSIDYHYMLYSFMKDGVYSIPFGVVENIKGQQLRDHARYVIYMHGSRSSGVITLKA